MQIWKSTEKKLHIKLPNSVPVKSKSIESNQNQSSPAIPNSNADPFESIIAPFLKVIIPHFTIRINRDTSTANS